MLDKNNMNFDIKNRVTPLSNVCHKYHAIIKTTCFRCILQSNENKSKHYNGKTSSVWSRHPSMTSYYTETFEVLILNSHMHKDYLFA